MCRADGLLADRLVPGESRALRILPAKIGGEGAAETGISAPSVSHVSAAPPPPNNRSEGVLRTLKDGWTVRRTVAHRVGKSDFEIVPVEEPFAPTKLGDWRGQFGEDFSGKAVYRVTFVSDRPQEATLDLGKVAWSAAVTFNGARLEGCFTPPLRWRVAVRKGENVLEVTVANLLVNALNEKEHRRTSSPNYRSDNRGGRGERTSLFRDGTHRRSDGGGTPIRAA